MILRSCVALLCIALPVFAQVDGSLTGLVFDSSKQPVPGAAVSLRQSGSNVDQVATVTTSDGLFTIAGITPNLYDLRVIAPGLQEYTLRGIKIDAAREASLPPITLTIEPLAINIEVNAPLQTVQAASPEVATTITTEQIRRLPIIDRTVLPLAATQAGVSGAGVINGQRSSSVDVTLDGINIRDNYIRNNAFFTPNLVVLDQVAEFTVTTSMADASLGGGALHIDLVTRSGRRALHADVN